MLDPARAALVRQALGRIELLQREGVFLMMPEMMMGRRCRERVASGSGFSLTRLDGGPSVRLKLNLQTSGDPYGSSLGGPVRTMIRAAPTARIGAWAVPRDARSASMTRMTGGRGAPPVHHPRRSGTHP